jgi:hypothetical protein
MRLGSGRTVTAGGRVSPADGTAPQTSLASWAGIRRTTGRGPFIASFRWDARNGGERAMRPPRGVVRKERMMLSWRLILMIALMVLHTGVNAALARPARDVAEVMLPGSAATQGACDWPD